MFSEDGHVRKESSDSVNWKGGWKQFDLSEPMFGCEVL